MNRDVIKGGASDPSHRLLSFTHAHHVKDRLSHVFFSLVVVLRLSSSYFVKCVNEAVQFFVYIFTDELVAIVKIKLQTN